MTSRRYRLASSEILARAATCFGVATALVLCSASIADAQARAENREITLLVGEQTSVPAADVQSYSEGRQGIADVRLAENPPRFVIVAIAPGTTTLLLLMRDGREITYRITVSSGEEAPSAVEARDNVRLDLYFVQISESYAHQIGIGWPSVIGGDNFRLAVTADLIGRRIASATASVANQPLPRIDLLQSTGWARIARQVALLTANGNEASYSSGGEVNVIATGSTGAGDLEQVQFGSDVRVLPRYDRGTNRIELRIHAEVSELADDRGTGVPGRNRSSVDTIVNLEMGQAVVLAGLLSDAESNSMTGLPGLSQIPILGIFFGSNARRREAVQNVVFIVPTLVDVVSMRAREDISDAFELYWEYSGGIDERVLFPATHDSPNGLHPSARQPSRRNGSSRSRPRSND